MPTSAIHRNNQKNSLLPFIWVPRITRQRTNFIRLLPNGNIYFTREIKGGKGSIDIVVRRYTNGTYKEAESLSDSINTAFDEFNAFEDPDGKHFFFTSNRSSIVPPFTPAIIRQQLLQKPAAAGNGLDDIYWVKFSVLQQLK